MHPATLFSCGNNRPSNDALMVPDERAIDTSMKFWPAEDIEMRSQLRPCSRPPTSDRSPVAEISQTSQHRTNYMHPCLNPRSMVRHRDIVYHIRRKGKAHFGYLSPLKEKRQRPALQNQNEPEAFVNGLKMIPKSPKELPVRSGAISPLRLTPGYYPLPIPSPFLRFDRQTSYNVIHYEKPYTG